MKIPDYLANLLDITHQDVPLRLLIRHSERYPILTEADVITTGLTQTGFELAEELGREIKRRGFNLNRVFSSPVLRCRDTAVFAARGAEWTGEVGISSYLSHPFISASWLNLQASPPDGTLPTEIQEMIGFILDGGGEAHSLDLLVTHDTNLAFLSATLFRQILDESTWPQFLEGMAFWQRGSTISMAWRGVIREMQVWDAGLLF